MNRNVDVVQQVRVVLHGVARREEDHDLFFFAVPFEKRKEQPEPILRRDDDVALLETRDGRVLLRVVDSDIDRICFDRESCQVFDLPRLCC